MTLVLNNMGTAGNAHNTPHAGALEQAVYCQRQGFPCHGMHIKTSKQAHTI